MEIQKKGGNAREKINSAEKYKKEVGESGKGGTTERRSEVENKGNFASSMPLSYQ